MAGMDQADVNETLRTVAGQAREAWNRFAEEVELERRMRENPLAVLGVAAAAGFVLGGGLWPVLRPFVKAATRAAMSPATPRSARSGRPARARGCRSRGPPERIRAAQTRRRWARRAGGPVRIPARGPLMRESIDT